MLILWYLFDVKRIFSLCCTSDMLFRLFEMDIVSVAGSLYVRGGVYGSGAGAGYNALPDQGGTVSPAPAISPSRFEPYFDTMTPRNVTALVGKSAYLSCRVRNLGNKTVSALIYRNTRNMSEYRTNVKLFRTCTKRCSPCFLLSNIKS